MEVPVVFLESPISVCFSKMEQIRRLNRLWASDSLFLRENLLIPVTENNSFMTAMESASSHNHTESVEILSPYSDDDDVLNFLDKIDNSIASTKEEVKKFQNREFASLLEDCSSDRKKLHVSSRKKQLINNNTVIDHELSQGKITLQGCKLRNSLQRLQEQQDELFEL
ncbi:hypothetical protein FQA39_LY03444 [Lamprigera yunnana]|nr:hypothetical protein FQA39_LY03444 [Lamprigera yunnana]